MSQKSVVFALDGMSQSWGVGRGISDKKTVDVPTYSGVIGIVLNALGHSREDDLDSDVLGMGFAVRVDRPGTLYSDFQTNASSGEAMLKDVEYISGAKFTVAMSSDRPEVVDRIARALVRPARPLYLGRSSSVVGSIDADVVDGDEVESLRDDLGSPIHFTSGRGDAPWYMLRDVPLSFAPGRRGYGRRSVTVTNS